MSKKIIMGGTEDFLMIKNANSKGFDEAREGDSVNLSFPESKTRRGRVGHEVAQTIQTGEPQGVVVKLKRGYEIEVNPEEEKSDDIDILGNYSKSNYKGTAIVNKKGISPTIRENHGQVTGLTETETDNLRIRKLTPKECWRLMGFTDEEFSKAREVNSDTQLYKQAGNSIVVDVLEAILRNLLTSDRREGDQQLTLFEGNEGGEEWQNGKPE